MVLLLHQALLLQSVLPASLQGAGHEPVLGLHGLILPLGSSGFLARSFEGLTPLVMKTFSLLLDVLDGPQAEVERGGLQRTEDLPRDQVVQRRRRDMTAVLAHGRPRMLAAVIA